MSATHLGPYEILRRIGKGGMAEVFQVRAREGARVGQVFALKRLLPSLEQEPEAVRLFAAEAELSRHLHHAHIVEVVDVGRADDGVIYLVMEHVDGRDAAQIVRRCQQQRVAWPIDFALYFTTALLDALRYAHAASGPDGRPLHVIHCDVSPSNFFLSRQGDLKLGDFGVARSRLEAGGGQVMGKPYYLSPEATLGHLSPGADLWAVGVTLYELLTLQRPFTGKTPDEVFEAIRASRYVPAREVRPELPLILEGVLARAFDTDPVLRFATAAEFLEALEPLLDERVGTPLAIAAMVRGLFGASDD
jgi:eukaryotic-like serine/threonine-protein kinase